MNEYICAKCGTPLSDEQEFCPKCGTRKKTDSIDVCRKCGTPFQEGQKFCPKCGRKVVTAAKAKKKKKVLALASVISAAVIAAGFFAAMTIINAIPSVEKFSAEGNYVEAYNMATDNEKSMVMQENAVAVATKTYNNSDNLTLEKAWINSDYSGIVLQTTSGEYLYSIYDNDNAAFLPFMSYSSLDEEDINSWGGSETKSDKILKNSFLGIVNNIISNGTELPENGIVHINGLLEKNILDDVNLIENTLLIEREQLPMVNMYMAAGNYAKAYDIATSGTEKINIVRENVVAFISAKSANSFNDKSSFALSGAWLNGYGTVVLKISGTNGLGGASTNYALYMYDKDSKKYSHINTYTSLKMKESNRFDTTEEMSEKLYYNLFLGVVETTIEKKGSELESSSVKNINEMFKNGILDEVELIDAAKKGL